MNIDCKMSCFQAVCFLKVKSEKRKKYLFSLLKTISLLHSNGTSFRGSLILDREASYPPSLIIKTLIIVIFAIPTQAKPTEIWMQIRHKFLSHALFYLLFSKVTAYFIFFCCPHHSFNGSVKRFSKGQFFNS